MAKAVVRDEISAKVDRVWACLRDFGDLRAWAPGDPEVTLEGSGVGAVRSVSMGGGMVVRERLTAFDEAGHSFGYEIAEGPMPFRDYAAKVALTSRAGDRTAIEWSSTFEPQGMSETDTIAMVEQLYRGFIDKLKQTLAG